jgi:hypothetical protein
MRAVEQESDMVARRQLGAARVALIGMLAVTVMPAPLSAAPAVALCTPASEPLIDLDVGNAPVELIIPPTIVATLESVSPGANDAPYVLRFTMMVTNGWFDAIAPYHEAGTAVGVYSDLGHRPVDERTDRNRNTAVLYASQKVLNSVLPTYSHVWDQMLCDAGLDPGDASADLATPIGIGNVAGAALVEARENDGMNQLGGYADTTGYQPVNSVDQLIDPSRWQPLEVPDGQGGVTSQTFITPQWSQVEPYSYDDVNQFTTPAPSASVPRGKEGRTAYEQQLNDVIEVSQNLTAEQKLIADFFDNKFASLGFSALAVLQSQQLTLEEFIHFDFLVNVAATDAGIPVWNEKIKHDAVRPVTAIRYHYSGERLPGWGGPPRPVDPELTSWTSYLDTADHPEYPSGSAAFCAAHAQAARLFLGSDDLGWEVDFSPQGPIGGLLGVVPTEGATLSFATWTEFEDLCNISRVYGGVHFRPASDEAQKMAGPIGTLAHAFLQAQLAGTGMVSTDVRD